jgi:hypothetical protein
MRPIWIELMMMKIGSNPQNIDSYQAQVWQNRLDTLDRLLSYGVRKQLNN